MIKLQERDYSILQNLAILEVMDYNQITKLHFPTKEACYVRVCELIKDKYIDATYTSTKEKLLKLTDKGIKLVNNTFDTDYKLADYGYAEHKRMRSQLYIELQKYDISDWRKEVLLKEINSEFDVAFEYNGRLYLAEIHNEQKTKVLKEKMVRLLNINANIGLLVYAKNTNRVKNLIEKLNEKGFEKLRTYQLCVSKFGKEVVL